jgi:hypothetical protein
VGGGTGRSHDCRSHGLLGANDGSLACRREPSHARAVPTQSRSHADVRSCPDFLRKTRSVGLQTVGRSARELLVRGWRHRTLARLSFARPHGLLGASDGSLRAAGSLITRGSFAGRSDAKSFARRRLLVPRFLRKTRKTTQRRAFGRIGSRSIDLRFASFGGFCVKNPGTNRRLRANDFACERPACERPRDTLPANDPRASGARERDVRDGVNRARNAARAHCVRTARVRTARVRTPARSDVRDGVNRARNAARAHPSSAGTRCPT